MKIRGLKFIFGALLLIGALVPSARADLFSSYAPTGNTFTVPTSAYDVSGGLIYYFSGNTLYRQDGFNVNSFSPVGHFGSAFSVNAFPAFVEFSHDGSRVAVGNNGGADFGTYQIAVFDASLLSGTNPDLAASSSIYGVNHTSAAWGNNTQLLLTAGSFGSPSVVTKLDTTSPVGSFVNPAIINNIGGASAGVALDAAGNLFTGNGFDGTGLSGTGWIKAIRTAAWQTSPPVDFEASPSATFVADLLSANSLAFDSEGNLLVGGGDFGSGDLNYFALISSAALNNLLTNGTPINPNDPAQVRKFDPSAAGSSFYTLAVDLSHNYFYALDGTTAYQFCPIPEPSSLGLVFLGLGLLAWRIRQANGRCGKRAKRILALSTGLLLACLPLHASNFFAEEVVDFSPGAGASGPEALPKVLGGPRGGGMNQGNVSDVLTLGETGSVTVGFNQKWIEDGPGSDFIVFENPFTVGGNPDLVFGELAFVEVSTDGTNFARFDSLSLNPGPIGPFGTLNKNLVSGLVGTQPVLANVDTNAVNPFDPSAAGGNAFDLSALANNALVLSGQVNLNQIRYLRLVDIKGDGTTLDSAGNPIYDATGFNNSADIDAVSVIHGIPEPSTWAMMAGGLLLAGLITRKRRDVMT
jgi:hypothetical protein